jgi:TPR repeat protein
MIENIFNLFQSLFGITPEGMIFELTPYAILNGTIVAIVVAIVAFMFRKLIWNNITWLIKWIRKKDREEILTFLKDYSSFNEEFLEKTESDEEEKIKNFYKRFKTYFVKFTEPTFLAHRFKGKELKSTTIKFKELFNKYIIDKNDLPRVLTIYAEAGMGKSRLLRFLAYKLLLHGRKEKGKDEKESKSFRSFVRHGVFYTEFKKYENIGSLFEEIERMKLLQEIKYLLLDGFDECREYNIGEYSSAQLLENFFNNLGNIDGIFRILITSRGDMLKNDREALKSVRINFGESMRPLDVIELDRFTDKQVLERYKTVNALHESKNSSNIVKKLRAHLKEDKNLPKDQKSILRIPFFIKYTNELFNDMAGKAMNYLTREVGLDIIVKERIKKERLRYKAIKKDIEENDYTIKMMSALGKTAYDMYKLDDLALSCEEYEKNVPDEYKAQKERLFVVRESIKDENSEEIQDCFRFQHKLFYEYFLTYFMVDYATFTNNEVIFSLGECKKLLGFKDIDEQFANNEEMDLRKRLYHYFLSKKWFLSENWFKVIEKNIESFSINNVKYPVKLSEIAIIKAEAIEIVDEPTENIDRIIFLLPLIKSLRYRKFKMNDYNNLEEYVDNRYLELSSEALLDPSGASRFGKLNVLDITDGKVEIEGLKNFLDNFDEVDEIRISIENIDDLNTLINAKLTKKFRLLVKVKSTDIPELTQMIVDANLKNERFCFCNTIKLEQIDTKTDIKSIKDKLIFLEQLYFIETHYSGFNNDDTKAIQGTFYNLFKQNSESLDKFLYDLLQKRTKSYGDSHPYTMNLLTLHSEAQYLVGNYYYYSERNFNKAVEWYQKAADQGNANGQCDLGICYERGRGVEQNFYKAVKWYQKAADQGDARGQCWLGCSYYDGNGVKQDFDKAIELCQKSANQGDASGQCWLGSFYCDGLSVKQDCSKAIELFQKAANQGDAYGQSLFGNCYYCGHSIKQDYKKAIEWFQEAASQDSASGELYLGICYYYGRGVEQDYSKAVEWFQKAANQFISTNISTQSWLGQCYYYGRGVEQDYDKAIELFQESANIGSGSGKHWLGRCYYKGHGIKQDYNEAVAWFQKAANQHNTNGQCWLGICYYEGNGVSQDYAKASELFEKSANRGNASGQYWLGRCYYEGNGPKQDYDKAYELFQKAANKNHASGQHWLGKCYFEGNGPKQDHDKAYELFQKAKSQGHADTQEWL